MRSIRSAAALLSACATLALAAPSQGSVMSFTSDASFIAFQNSGGFTKTFGGNVRWGNAASNGDWERAIVDANDIPIGSPAQNAWSLSNVHDVTFTFDAALSEATLDLSGVGSITRAVPASPEVLFARIRDSAGVATELKDIQIDLAFNGAGIDYTVSELIGDGDAEFWGISDSNLKFGFSLTAKVLFAGPQTAGSDPMYQFKVGVPSPGAAALLAIAGSMGARRKR